MDNTVSAIAVFKDHGVVNFIENGKRVMVNINLSGLPPGLHGFHIQTFGDLTNDNCTHFNPFNKNHGSPFSSTERHVGDLGNIIVAQNGKVVYSFYDTEIKLRGYKSNIVGRCLVICEFQDDCGKGTDIKRKESIKTGNSGQCIARAVIGYSKNS